MVFAGVQVIHELIRVPRPPMQSETQVNRNLMHACWHA